MADYRENWTVDDWKVELDEAIYQIHEYISIDNRMSKEYYPGIFLMPREMHTIEAVVIHPGINATSLASVMGFSKGMLSKLIRELERRGMVTAYKKRVISRKCITVQHRWAAGSTNPMSSSTRCPATALRYMSTSTLCRTSRSLRSLIFCISMAICIRVLPSASARARFFLAFR